MNRLFFVIASVVIAGLSSCNKELDQAPAPAKARVGALPPVAITQKRYQLTRRGDNVLTYDSFPFNRLSKVTSMNKYGGTTFYEYNDTPGNQSIKTTRYLGSQIWDTDVFHVEENGLCSQADYWSFIYDPTYSQTQPAEVLVVHKKYAYTNGRLKTIYITAESASHGGSLQPFGEPRTDNFFYSADGELTMDQTFVGQKKTAEVTYGYGQAADQLDAEDKLSLNLDEVTKNPYLPIFGKFSKNLVRLTVLKNYDGSTPAGGNVTFYDYVLNKEGYVVSRETRRGWDRFMLTEAYEYSVSTRSF